MMRGTIEKIPLLSGAKLERVGVEKRVQVVWYLLKDDPDDPNNKRHSMRRRHYLLKHFIESTLAENPGIEQVLDKEQMPAKGEQSELRKRRPSLAPLSSREEAAPCIACDTCVVL